MTYVICPRCKHVQAEDEFVQNVGCRRCPQPRTNGRWNEIRPVVVKGDDDAKIRR